MLTARIQRNSANVMISCRVAQLSLTRGWHHIPAAGEHEGGLGPPHPQQWPPYTGLLAKGCLNVPGDGASLSVLHTTVLMIVLIPSSHPRIVHGNKGHLKADNPVIYPRVFDTNLSKTQLILCLPTCRKLLRRPCIRRICSRYQISCPNLGSQKSSLATCSNQNTSCKYLLQIPFVCVFPTLTSTRAWFILGDNST